MICVLRRAERLSIDPVCRGYGALAVDEVERVHVPLTADATELVPARGSLVDVGEASIKLTEQSTVERVVRHHDQRPRPVVLECCERLDAGCEAGQFSVAAQWSVFSCRRQPLTGYSVSRLGASESVGAGRGPAGLAGIARSNTQ